MGKLYYFYGTMSSAKSLNLLAKCHQFRSTGTKVVLMKPGVDTRDVGYISSRAGLKEECILIEPNEEIRIPDDIEVLMVDEVQFLTKRQVIQLWSISRNMNIRVFCFGLKTTYLNELFESVKTLIVYCDSMHEIKSQCNRCQEKATTHLLYRDNVPVLTGEEFNVGDMVGAERFESLCQSCRDKIAKK